MRTSDPKIDPVRGFTLPRELMRSAPRDVRLTRGGRALVAVAWLLAIAGITSGALLYREARRQADAFASFDRGAVSTTAIVDRLWRKKGDGEPAYAGFHFVVNGERVEGQVRMRTSAWRELRVAGPLGVRYLPDEPDRWAVDGARDGPLAAPVAYVVATIPTVASLLCMAAVRRQRTLLSEGRAAPARITTLKKRHGSHGATHHEIRYEFPLLGGGMAAGRAAAPKSSVVGSTIFVVYDPDRPARNQPYPFSLVTPFIAS